MRVASCRVQTKIRRMDFNSSKISLEFLEEHIQFDRENATVADTDLAGNGSVGGDAPIAEWD